MSASIEVARENVQSAFAQLMSVADSSEERTLWAVERELWSLILALGRALLTLFFARQAARPRATSYKVGNIRYELLPGYEHVSDLGTLFGKVKFARPLGRRNLGRRRKADLPVDRELGVFSGYSLSVSMGVARLCAQMPFATAREMWRNIFEWAPSSRGTLRIVDAVAGRARQFLEQAPAPEDDGEILVLQVDGGAAPMIGSGEYRRRTGKRAEDGRTRQDRKQRRHDSRRPRKKKGDKSKNGKVAFVGVLYTLKNTDAEGLQGPVNKRFIATFESHRSLMVWLRAEADKRGYGRKKTIFLADGSDHIWRLQQEYFPQAECCVDWYHVVEYLWKAGRSLYREGSADLEKWVKKQKDCLSQGEVAEVLAHLRTHLERIPKTGPGNKGKRQRLKTALDYLTNQKDRMPYASFLERGLDIGSGAVEGAIRNLVRMRLDGPGMRWGRQRSEHVLHLRTILLNKQWDDFVVDRAADGDFQFAPHPEPATPYNATTKVAA